MIAHRLAVALCATLWLLAAGPGASAAEPQKVFRCGPDGRVYSQSPCKDGRDVDAADQRSPEQRKAAEEVVKREEKLADKMARERQAREAAAAKQGATIIGAAKPAAYAASAPVKKKKLRPKPPTQL
jgi:hypothetical protein